MTPARKTSSLPRWTIVRAGDPRERPGAVEAPPYVSAEWARSIRATSNRPWINAAKVIAAIVEEHPEARYVEGWAAQTVPVWHGCVDLPIGSLKQSWLRIDATPKWRWTLDHNRYGAVLELQAAALAPFVAPLLEPRGRALCRLPMVPLAPASKLATFHPLPADRLAADFGAEAAYRSSEVRRELDAWNAAHGMTRNADAVAELVRLAAMRVLPKP